MPIPLLFQEKFIEKYFKKFHLPKIQFQPLGVWFMNLLPYHWKALSEERCMGFVSWHLDL